MAIDDLHTLHQSGNFVENGENGSKSSSNCVTCQRLYHVIFDLWVRVGREGGCTDVLAADGKVLHNIFLLIFQLL